MEDSLIPGIRKAIENCSIDAKKMESECSEVMKVLIGARYLNASTLHLVERQYNDKISNVRQEITDMQTHIKELEGQNV